MQVWFQSTAIKRMLQKQAMQMFCFSGLIKIMFALYGSLLNALACVSTKSGTSLLSDLLFRPLKPSHQQWGCSALCLSYPHGSSAVTFLHDFLCPHNLANWHRRVYLLGTSDSVKHTRAAKHRKVKYSRRRCTCTRNAFRFTHGPGCRPPGLLYWASWR